MEQLFEFFKALALILGCVILVLLIVSIITAPFRKRQRQKQQEEISKQFLEILLNSIVKEEQNEDKPKKARKTKKNVKGDK